MRNSKKHSKCNLELLHLGRRFYSYMAYGLAIMLVLTFHRDAVAGPPGPAPVLGFEGGYLDIEPMGTGICLYWYHLPPQWRTEWRARLEYEIKGNELTIGKVEVAEALKGRRIGSLLYGNMEVPDTVTVVHTEWREDNLRAFNRALYRFGEDTPEGRLAAGNQTPAAKLWKKLGWQLESVNVENSIPSVEYSRMKPKVEVPLSPPRPQPCSSTKPEFSVDLESGVRPLTQRFDLLRISGVSKVAQRPSVVVGPATLASNRARRPNQVDLIVNGTVVRSTDSRGNWNADGPGGGAGQPEFKMTVGTKWKVAGGAGRAAATQTFYLVGETLAVEYVYPDNVVEQRRLQAEALAKKQDEGFFSFVFWKTIEMVGSCPPGY